MVTGTALNVFRVLYCPQSAPDPIPMCITTSRIQQKTSTRPLEMGLSPENQINSNFSCLYFQKGSHVRIMPPPGALNCNCLANMISKSCSEAVTGGGP